jgi:dTDP-4-dehydrorhamnose reductase
MKIMIVGANGRLGRALSAQLTALGHQVTAATRQDLDVTDFAAVQRSVAHAAPQVVIHAAAWTDVDGCAREPQRAIVVNGLGAQHSALAAAQVGAAVVYVSTNEVFDGRMTSRPYYEYDARQPINGYGYSKYVGEQAVAQVNPRHYIVRTAWLFAHGGKNFIQTILNAARAGKPLRVVTDEVANPTYTDDLAAALCQLIASERYGTYHFVNEGACSRYAFARYALQAGGLGDTPIEPITHHEWARPSTPPVYTPMANLAGAHIGITLRTWQDAVQAFIAAEATAQQANAG